MEKYNNRTIGRSSALRGLAVISGLLAYLPVYLLFSKEYLTPGDRYFAKDIVLFIASVTIVVACLFIWKAIYKQFKNDKTRLGFAPDKSGVALTVEIIIEAILALFLLHFSSSGLL